MQHIITACYKSLLSQNFSKLPIDLRSYKRNGCYIISFQKYSSCSGLLLSDLTVNGKMSDGYYIPNLNGHKVILYNECKPENRINFTLAHEIAHMELGHFPDAFSEFEADLFASFLLMPDALIKKYVNSGSTISESFLRKTFGVSNDAATIKLEQIFKYGLIENELDVEIRSKFSHEIRKNSKKLSKIDKANSLAMLRIEKKLNNY